MRRCTQSDIFFFYISSKKRPTSGTIPRGPASLATKLLGKPTFRPRHKGTVL